MTTDKKKDLEKIKQDMQQAAGTLPLTKTAEDIVPAEGNSDADMFFIGEAAGYHELVQHRPFVGAAGQLLIKTLAGFGIKREEVWISNVVKTRPPGNRDPLPEEIEAFRPYLDREIEVIQPKMIVTLGRFSMGKFFGPNVKISQIHGQPRWVNFTLPSGKMFKVVVFPMFHPAAALRASAVLQMFNQDAVKLIDVLKKIKNPTTPSGDKITVEVPKEEKKENVQLTLL